MSNDLVTAIDKAVRDQPNEKRRGHMGASSIGSRCKRQVWYAFRWAYNEKHTGRILRLFNRGHEEEARFARWLRMAGCEVQDYAQRLCFDTCAQEYVCIDWDLPIHPDYEDVSDNPHHIALAKERGEGPQQWGFTDHGGHFSGSSDGRIRAGKGCTLTLPDGWGLLEEKTHNEKSFKQLTGKGVLTAKPTHYVQMQIYMHYMGLTWALYISVNKNDDTLYTEIVHYRPEIAMSYVVDACKLVEARTPPPRLTEDPSWFECKFCAFREICHYEDAPQKNCRSCVFASTAPKGEWNCGKYSNIIPDGFVPLGCDAWEPIE